MTNRSEIGSVIARMGGKLKATAKIEGLDAALRAMAAAFPKAPKEQRKVLTQAMGAGARKHILPHAKQLALQGDGSGALSESLAVRTLPLRTTVAEGVAAAVAVVPVRNNRRAIAKYIQHYYTSQGRVAPASVVTGGIRHGHLVEFGTGRTSASPFLLPAGRIGQSGYVRDFASTLGKKIESNVRRAARRK